MQKKAAVVALGMFDGVHMGHRKLLSAAVRMAAEMGAVPVAYTFSNSPQSIFRDPPPILTLPEEKAEIIRALGLEVQMEAFTEKFASQQPLEFIEMLMDQYDLRGVVCGFNYHFGSKRAGNPEVLREFGERNGFQTCVVPAVIYCGAPVSSTRIRTALLEGDIRGANAMLVDPFFYKGTVVAHKQLGTKLGFPTANLLPGGKLLPPFGVYAAEAEVEGQIFGAVANVGVRPTVDSSSHPMVTVEPYLLDFNGNLYGKELTLRLISFLRGEHKFESKEALKAQIAHDAQTAALHLNEYWREQQK